jgi:hypothetical protein
VQLSDLQRGDILLLKDSSANHTWTHGWIKKGQKLTGLNFNRSNQGESGLVHALIYIGKEMVAEASGEAGAVRARVLLRPTFAPEVDDTVNHYLVFRCKDRELARLAAKAGNLWAKSAVGIGYAKTKAISSILHSDSYGEHGKIRAQGYADQLDEAMQSGVVSVGPFAEGGAFCSEFVVACYQAAALHLERYMTGTLLQCDAKHCSVRALHDRLLGDRVLFQIQDSLNLGNQS